LFDALVLKQLDKLLIEAKLWGNDNNVYSVCLKSLRAVLAFFCMLIWYVTVISTIGHVSFIKMDRFELMAAQLLLYLLPEYVEWCGDYCETVFIEGQKPVVLPAHG